MTFFGGNTQLKYFTVHKMNFHVCNVCLKQPESNICFVCTGGGEPASYNVDAMADSIGGLRLRNNVKDGM